VPTNTPIEATDTPVPTATEAPSNTPTPVSEVLGPTPTQPRTVLPDTGSGGTSDTAGYTVWAILSLVGGGLILFGFRRRAA
jgi:hypothetical protein